jgi:hypothetical protein
MVYVHGASLHCFRADEGWVSFSRYMGVRLSAPAKLALSGYIEALTTSPWPGIRYCQVV